MTPVPKAAGLHQRQLRNTLFPGASVSRVPRHLTTHLACSSASNHVATGNDLHWRADFRQRYVMGKHVGGGSFGQVNLGIDLQTGQEVAVKVMPKQRGKITRERTCQKLMTEVAILNSLQECPNVVRLLGYFEEDEQVLVVTEYCSGGDLQRIYEQRTEGLSERAVALIAYEVLKVIQCCHSRGIIHGDVKPANFVLKVPQKLSLTTLDATNGPWLKAVDFGCSQILDGSGRLSKRTGTPVYMAPEIFQRDYSTQADLWSLGVMLYQLFAARFPFWEGRDCSATKLEDVMQAVLETEITYDYGPWHYMTPEGRDFVKGCLNRDQNQRLTIDQALRHKWFTRFMAAGSRTPVSVQSNIVPSKRRVRERQQVW